LAVAGVLQVDCVAEFLNLVDVDPPVSHPDIDVIDTGLWNVESVENLAVEVRDIDAPDLLQVGVVNPVEFVESSVASAIVGQEVGEKILLVVDLEVECAPRLRTGGIEPLLSEVGRTAGSHIKEDRSQLVGGHAPLALITDGVVEQVVVRIALVVDAEV